MADEKADELRHVVEVEFNQQQDVILKKLKEDGRYGTTDEEIIRNAFDAFLRQTRL
jgi:hypothetical protein